MTSTGQTEYTVPRHPHIVTAPITVSVPFGIPLQIGAFAPRLELLYEVLKIGGSRATRSVLQIQPHRCPASCTCARDHWLLVSSMSLNASMIGYRIPERSSPGSRPSTYSYLPLTRPGRPPMSTCVLVDPDTENWNDGYQNFHAP